MRIRRARALGPPLAHSTTGASMAHEHRHLSEWVTYNEYMCSLIRRVGAPTALEIATIWLDTIGKWAQRSEGTQSDG